MSQSVKPALVKYKPKDPKRTCRYCTHALFIYLDEKVRCSNEKCIYNEQDKLFDDSCPLFEEDKNDPRLN